MIIDSEIEKILEWSKSIKYAPQRDFYEKIDLYPEQPSKNARLLILNYADYFSKIINGYLRKEDNYYPSNSHFNKLYRRLLDTSLKECNSFNNSQVFRIDNPSIDADFAIKWYKSKIGEIICYPYFLSTTKVLLGSGKLYLYIETTNRSSGKDIEPYLLKGKAKLEREVLFMSGSMFKVKYVSELKNIVYLTEVSRNQKNGFIVVNDHTFYKDQNILSMLDERYSNQNDRELSLSEQGLI